MNEILLLVALSVVIAANAVLYRNLLAAADRDRESAALREQDLRDIIREVQDQLLAEQDRLLPLIEQIVDLKKAGFATLSPEGALPKKDPLPPQVREAIRHISTAGSSLERELTAWATEQLANGESPVEEVAQKILVGSTEFEGLI